MMPMGHATTERTPTQPRPSRIISWPTEAPCHTPRLTPPGPSPGLYQGIGPGTPHTLNEDEDGHDSAVCEAVVSVPWASVRGAGDNTWSAGVSGCDDASWNTVHRRGRPFPTKPHAPHSRPPSLPSISPNRVHPRLACIHITSLCVSTDFDGSNVSDTHNPLADVSHIYAASASDVSILNIVVSSSAQTSPVALFGLDIADDISDKLGAPVCPPAPSVTRPGGQRVDVRSNLAGTRARRTFTTNRLPRTILRPAFLILRFGSGTASAPSDLVASRIHGAFTFLRRILLRAGRDVGARVYVGIAVNMV